MEYSPTGEEDERCNIGTGDITEVGGGECRTTPTNEWDRRDKIEARCIFPYYIDGQEYTGCTQTEIQDFTKPVFICPIRTIKGSGNNYTSEDATAKYCPTNAIDHSSQPYGDFTFNAAGPVYNEYNGEWELDPDNIEGCEGYNDFLQDNDPYYYARPVFATCKNTCPGGETETVHIVSL